MFSQYAELRSTNSWIGSGVWGTPANFNGFHVLASLLQRRRKSTKLCTMFGRLLGWYTVYIHFWGLLPQRNFARCKIHFVSKSCILLYWQCYCTALEQQVLAEIYVMLQGMELRNFCRGCHLYSAGWPLRWASAHILVNNILLDLTLTHALLDA